MSLYSITKNRFKASLRPNALALLTLLAFLGLSLKAHAQGDDLLFKNGKRPLLPNLENLEQSGTLPARTLFKGAYHVLLQFVKLPSDAERHGMLGAGIRLLDYMPTNAYYAQVSAPINWASLKKYGVSAIYSPVFGEKTSEVFQTRPFASFATNSKPGYVDLRVDIWGAYSRKDIEADVYALGGRFIRNEPLYGTIEFRVPLHKADDVVELAWVQYADLTSRPKVAYNFVERGNHRSAAVYSAATYGLTGAGVTVGEWDGGCVDSHLDFTSRLFVKEGSPNDHATHVGGTTAGAGLLNPLRMGMAPKAKLYSWDFDGDTNLEMSNAMLNPSDRFEITTNSWGNGFFGCPTPGVYDADARFVDMFCNDYPFMSAQWAIGNSQGAGCVAGGFRSITSGWEISKNCIGVGALNSADGMTGFSSFGPVSDGRIKPEICGIGENVNSTTPGNNYGSMSGTSMSTPGVSGTIAQIYEWYKNVKGGGVTFPQNALIKATLLNNAQDFGNAGPDYRFGYGRINALNTIKAMEENRYEENMISGGGSYNKTITVPAGTSQLRVMIVWRDPAAAVSAAPALVNNLNLTVTDPASAVFNPWILDPAVPSATAVRGVDNLNNMEQVTINNPPAGDYTINVAGTSVPTGPQSYALTWSIDQPYIRVTYPIGGEQLETGTNYTVNWDGLGIAGTQTLEFSLNNGATWTTLSSSLASTARSFSWTTPGTISNQALIRVTSGALSDQSDAVFSLLRRPTGLAAVTGCGTANLTWTAVTSATSYDVLKLNTTTGNYDFVANTAVASYSATGLALGSHWFAVVAKHAGTGAVSIRSNAINVNIVLAANDMQMVAILSPTCDFAAPGTQAVTIRLKSNACATLPTGTIIPVSYTRGVTVSENMVLAAPLASGGFVNYTFTTLASFPAPGTYFLDAAVAFPGDVVASNNTVTGYEVKSAVNLPLYEDFENPNPAPCWTRTQNAGSDGFIYSPSNSSGSFSIPPHTQYASSNDDACDCNMAADFLITPRLNFSGHVGVGLNFQAVYPNDNFGSQAFVKVSTTSASGPWTTVYTLTGVDATWQNINISLSAYDGAPQVWVAFHHDDDGSWGTGLAVDDVKICSSNAPSLVSLSPTNGATGVAVGANLMMTFDQEISAGIGNITITDGVTPIVIPVTSSQVTIAGNVLTINPTADLAFSKTYSVSIAAAAIRNVCGINYTAGTWSFTTVAPSDVTPPVFVALSPTNGAVGVALDTDCSITFSETVLGTAGGTVSIFTAAGVLVQTFPLAGFSGGILVLNPTADLLPSTVYYIIFAPGSLQDAAGNAFTQIQMPTDWRFTTGTGASGSAGAPAISLTPPLWIKAVGINTTSIDLRWYDMTPNESGYRIYRSTANGFEFGLLTTVPAGSGEMNFVDTGLQPDTRYVYFVRPYVGEVYQTSDEAIGFTYPNAPTLVSVRDACLNASGQIEVKGTHLSGEFYWYESETAINPLVDVSGATITKGLFTTSPLTAEKRFYVTAKGQGFESAPRTAVTVLVKPLPTSKLMGLPTQFACTSSYNLAAEEVPGATYDWYLNTVKIATTSIPNYVASQTGSYTMSANLNGCSSISEAVRVVLNYQPEARILEGTTPTLCAGGSLNAKLLKDANYEWFSGTALAGTGPSLPVTESGVYTLLVTKNGCSATAETTVKFGTLPAKIEISATNTEVCPNGTTELSAPSISGATYEWLRDGKREALTNSNTLETNKTGVYTVLINNLGCTGTSDEITIRRIAVPSVKITGSGFNELTAKASDGSISTEITWLLNGDVLPEFTGKTTITPTQNGTYKVVWGTGGCETESGSIRFVLSVLGTDDNEAEKLGFKFYPNPTQKDFFITLPTDLRGTVRIELIDELGRTLQTKELAASGVAQVVSLDLAKLAKGLYAVRIMNEGTIYTTKVVKE